MGFRSELAESEDEKQRVEHSFKSSGIVWKLKTNEIYKKERPSII